MFSSFSLLGLLSLLLFSCKFCKEEELEKPPQHTRFGSMSLFLLVSISWFVSRTKSRERSGTPEHHHHDPPLTFHQSSLLSSTSQSHPNPSHPSPQAPKTTPPCPTSHANFPPEIQTLQQHQHARRPKLFLLLLESPQSLLLPRGFPR